MVVAPLEGRASTLLGRYLGCEPSFVGNEMDWTAPGGLLDAAISVACRMRRLRVASLLVALFLPAGCLAGSNVTATQFAVTEGGAATISIPIQVPRGIGGMEPQLSLNYSSAGGNGLLGIGWWLQGPSSITRCPQTMATDGVRGAVAFNTNDRFCLDGQRLLLIDPANPNSSNAPNQANYGGAGTEYRTERDSFSRITAVGSYLGQTRVPAGFEVKTKSGLILEFGNVLDGAAHSSQVPTNYSDWSTGSPLATINRWMLRRISDRLINKNFVEFVYCSGQVTNAQPAPVSAGSSGCTGPWVGSAPLHYIQYTNRGNTVNGTFAVVFRYDSRRDMIQSFHAGSSIRQTQRMSAIQTHIGFSSPSSPGTMVRSYDIHYEPIEAGSASLRATNASRISRIEERGDDGVSTLPALTFKMPQDLVFGDVVMHSPGTTAVAPPRIPECGGVTHGRMRQLCR